MTQEEISQMRQRGRYFGWFILLTSLIAGLFFLVLAIAPPHPIPASERIPLRLVALPYFILAHLGYKVTRMK